MKIACLSGKGGAGKTFVAVNLAAAARKSTYIDCDVEEPNGHLFLKPKDIKSQTVSTLLPSFDSIKCNGCRKCVKFCKFHALIYIKEKPMIFSEVCHSCGGCVMLCNQGAITEIEHPVGNVEIGKCENITVVTGILNPGEASGVPVIRHALKQAQGLTILDCPPGSACSVMESIMDADFCVLVVEPTSFGYHNFKMVYELVTILGKKSGVIINKQIEAYEPLEVFCRENHIKVLDRIIYQPMLGELIAKGAIVTQCIPEENIRFTNILHKIGGLI